jgi:hypothetical protein
LVGNAGCRRFAISVLEQAWEACRRFGASADWK